MSNITINPELCKGCGQCVKQCICAVLKVENGKAVIANPGSCMSCGHCQSVCGSGAISLFGMKREELPKERKTIEDLIKTRRSIRHYKTEPIPKEELKEMLNMTRFVPSACNFRTTKFHVIGRPVLTEMLLKLAKIALESGMPDGFKEMIKHQEQVDIICRDAPQVVIAYADKEDSAWGEIDAAIYLANFELVLTERGYGSLWCGLLHQMLKLPGAMKVIGLEGKSCRACLAVGTPNEKFNNLVQRQDTEITFA